MHVTRHSRGERAFLRSVGREEDARTLNGRAPRARERVCHGGRSGGGESDQPFIQSLANSDGHTNKGSRTAADFVALEQRAIEAEHAPLGMVQKHLEVFEEPEKRAVPVNRQTSRECLNDGGGGAHQFAALHSDDAMHRRRQEPEPLDHGAQATLGRDCHDEVIPLRDAAPKPQRPHSASYPDDHKDRVIGVDVSPKEGILCTAGGSGERAAMAKPLLDALRFRSFVCEFREAKLRDEGVKNERRQTLADVGVDHDAEPQAIFGHELNSWIEVIGEMWSGITSHYCLP